MLSSTFLMISPGGMELIFGLEKGSITAPMKEFFDGVYVFIVDTINNLAYIASLLGSFVVNIDGYFAWLPGSVSSLLVTLFGIVVVYVIAGRK